ncbi:hypothetical protein B0A49_02797 [Cryomyces minteri]|uniref:Uncharacterized protein n=1 Tax=Cryomyces minteri TaxID=331657 RepID=A0A4U0XTU1_9PEZI|nr:hypothetical protein B0A49_02797 [Cryomyces minteri]
MSHENIPRHTSIVLPAPPPTSRPFFSSSSASSSSSSSSSSSYSWATPSRLQQYRVEEGDILWLKKKADMDKGSIFHSQHSSNPYNHPAVVVKGPEESGDTVEICCLTSFDVTSLEQKFSGRLLERMREVYLPLDEAPAHPDSTHLRLEAGPPLLKRSYVETTTVYRIELANLGPCGSRRVSAASMSLIAKHQKTVGVVRAWIKPQLPTPPPSPRKSSPPPRLSPPLSSVSWTLQSHSSGIKRDRSSSPPIDGPCKVAKTAPASWASLLK